MKNIILRQAKKTDIPTLKNLWQICFNDRMRYIDVFFEHMFVPENTIVAEVEKRVAGVVYLLERSLNGKKFLYGYAIGVFPEFRGNNICESMLNKVKEYTQKNDILFGLHPANDKLSEFYQRIGLKEMYSLKEVDATKFSSDECFVLDDITADEFYEMRSNSFVNSVDWDKNALSYILKNGETIKKIKIEENYRYFVLNKYDDVVFVKETTASDSEILRVSESIKKHFKASNIYYLLSSKNTLQGNIKPMIYGFSQKDDDVYMNLFLD